MTKVYYVDVAVPSNKKKRERNKNHTVFDGNRVFKVKKLTELKDATEVFIDSLFPQIYEDVLELLEKGVRIYALRNLRVVKIFRNENGVGKSDENVAMILAKIPKVYFKELALKEMKLLRLILVYEKCVKWRKIIQQWTKFYPLEPLEGCVKGLRSIRDRYGRKIIEEVMKNENYVTVYRIVCEGLGLKDSVIVAILTVKLPLNWRFSRLKGLLGLVPMLCRGKNHRYNHKLRAHLTRLAMAIYTLKKRQHKYLDDLKGLSFNKTFYVLQLRILRTLKKAWQQQRQLLLAGEQ